MLLHNHPPLTIQHNHLQNIHFTAPLTLYIPVVPKIHRSLPLDMCGLHLIIVRHLALQIHCPPLPSNSYGQILRVWSLEIHYPPIPSTKHRQFLAIHIQPLQWRSLTIHCPVLPSTHHEQLLSRQCPLPMLCRTAILTFCMNMQIQQSRRGIPGTRTIPVIVRSVHIGS